jgi:hypothetical protein
MEGERGGVLIALLKRSSLNDSQTADGRPAEGNEEDSYAAHSSLLFDQRGAEAT